MNKYYFSLKELRTNSHQKLAQKANKNEKSRQNIIQGRADILVDKFDRLLAAVHAAHEAGEDAAVVANGGTLT